MSYVKDELPIFSEKLRVSRDVATILNIILLTLRFYNISCVVSLTGLREFLCHFSTSVFFLQKCK